MYAESARSNQRIRLPDIRRGEYEGLEAKITSSEWIPDFGKAEFKPRIGATATGARQILIAYNVNLNTSDKKKANTIAGAIRTSGVILRDDNGEKYFQMMENQPENQEYSNTSKQPDGCIIKILHKFQ